MYSPTTAFCPILLLYAVRECSIQKCPMTFKNKKTFLACSFSAIYK